ncbi:Predicted oxidoreductase [Tenacibaculum sp. 190524A02b]|uniref:Predicted oxidoreductase n=1 Tax=Tenacibaculum vairaonense TaxID=3137860 RepID=A0ABM9PJQ4_9FLAO
MKSKLILGTVQFGLKYGINNIEGKLSEQSIREILDTAFEKGIDILDTAEVYGDAQKRIGDYHKLSDNKFEVITKFNSKESLRSNIIERVEKDIETLRVDSLYAYMFHSFTDFEKYFEKYSKDLILLRNKGVIKRIGVSLYTNEEISRVLGNENVDLIQLPFNLLDNNTKRKDIIKKAKEKGIEIHTRSVFLQGLFFKKTNELPGNLELLKPYLDNLHNLCREDIKINDIALNYAVKNNDIDKVLIGVDGVSQLLSNVMSEKRKVLNGIIDEIDAIKVKEVELLNPSNW